MLKEHQGVREGPGVVLGQSFVGIPELLATPQVGIRI